MFVEAVLHFVKILSQSCCLNRYPEISLYGPMPTSEQGINMANSIL